MNDEATASNNENPLPGYPVIAPESRIELPMTIGLIASLILLFAYVSMVEIDHSLEARGIFMSQGSVARIAAIRGGLISEVLSSDGRLVERGEEIFMIEHPRADAKRIIALYTQRREQLAVKLERTQVALSAARSGSGVRTPSLSVLSEVEDQLNMALLEVDGRLDSLRASEKTVVSSPRKGRMIDLRVHPGDVVREGETLAEIVDETPVFRALAYVPGPMAGKLKVGAASDLRLDKGSVQADMVLHGRIRHISKLPVAIEDIDPVLGIKQPAFEVEILLDRDQALMDASKNLVPGEFAIVKLRVDRRTIAGWVLDRLLQ